MSTDDIVRRIIAELDAKILSRIIGNAYGAPDMRDWKNHKPKGPKLPWKTWELTARRAAKMTEFIPDAGAAFSSSVRNRLLEMADWMRLHKHVTKDMTKAISNMEEAVLNWLVDLEPTSWQPDVELWERQFRQDVGAEPAEEEKREWWDVLGCLPSSSSTEVKEAYRAAARKAHPDRGGTVQAMQEVNAAWEEYQKIFT